MSVSEQDLSTVKLFDGLPAEVLAALRRHAADLSYSDGQIVAMEGDRQRHVLFVRRGHLRAYQSCSQGREQTIIQLGPGDTIYLPCVFASCADAPTNAVAVGDVHVMAIESDVFRTITINNPPLAAAVLNDLSDKLRHVVCLARDLSLRSVRARLAQFLLDQYQSKNEAPIRWTQEQIAGQIGSVREVVGRVLRAFIREGLIRMRRQRIAVLDPEGLRLQIQ